MKDTADLSDRPAAPRTDDVSRLATRALAVLAARRVPGPGAGISDRLHMLSNAFIDADPEVGRLAVDRALGEGVATWDLIDHVIPATARLLGERWGRDEMSFADVTIATARLQETVRMLGARLHGRPTRNGAGAPVLLVLPRPEQHTLGLMVAADQLRRIGLRAQILFGPHPRELRELLRRRDFGMVGISASGPRSLAAVRELVDTVRNSARRFVPVVLGGPVLEAEIEREDPSAGILLSADIRDAARRCGLVPRHVATGRCGDGTAER